MAWLAAVAIVFGVLAFDVYRFLYGDVIVPPAGGSLSGLVVSPDGRTVYLASFTGGITTVSAATGKAGKVIAISGGTPGDFNDGPTSEMVITPDGQTLFTTVYDKKSGGPLPSARVDLRTGKEIGPIQVLDGAFGFVMSRDGKTLYVVSGDNQLYAVNAVTGRPERHIPAPQSVLDGEENMVLSPDGRTLYMAVPGDFGSGKGAVVPVNLQTGAAGRSVSVGWEPASLAVTPDGRTLYAAVDGMDAFGQSFPNRVVAIDTATGRVRASIPWQAPPQKLAMASDGATVWVMSVIGDRGSTADDTVTPVSVASDQPGLPFRTAGWLNSDQDQPVGVMLSPDGRRVYVAVSAGLETFGVGNGILATGWDVIALAVLWPLILTVLVLDFAGIVRCGTAWRWQGTGLLLMFSPTLINTSAQYGGWSSSWIHSLTWPVTLAGLVLVIGGSLVMGRKRRRAPQAGYPGK
jgi:DNA-binding beta-propeller fold protein YncE